MTENISEQIAAAIKSVEHPAIALSLVDLGIVRDFQIHEKEVTIILALPFAAVPQMIRDVMINGLKKEVSAVGGTIKDVSIEIMTDEERQDFMQKEQANWKG